MKNLLATYTLGGLLALWCVDSDRKVHAQTAEALTTTLSDSLTTPQIVNRIYDQTPDIEKLVEEMLTKAQNIVDGQVAWYVIYLPDHPVNVWFIFNPDLKHEWLARWDTVVINLASIEHEYLIANEIVQEWLQTVAIPKIEEYLCAILRQELYHATAKNLWNEWISELVSLADKNAWSYFLITRLGVTYDLLMGFSTFEKLTEWYPDNIDAQQYNEIYKNFNDAVLAVDPNFVKNNPTWLFLTYLQQHPTFVSDVYDYVISKEKLKIQ